jgi:gliding motility-associated-like protein
MKRIFLIALVIFMYTAQSGAQNKLIFTSSFQNDDPKNLGKFIRLENNSITLMANEKFTFSPVLLDKNNIELTGRFLFYIDNMMDTFPKGRKRYYKPSTEDFRYSYDENIKRLVYSFSQQGGHYIRLIAEELFGSNPPIDTIIQFQVALEPQWTVNVNPQSPLCKNETFTLSGKAATVNWTDNPLKKMYLEKPKLIDKPKERLEFVYDSIIRHFAAKDSIITAKNLKKLESVAIELEHESAIDVEIVLKCPKNTIAGGRDSIILKKRGQVNQDIIMGQPYFSTEGMGLTARYVWSQTPGYPTMEEGTFPVHNASTAIIPDVIDKSYFPNQKDYKPSESFDNLIGCTVNGEWHLIVRDQNGRVPSAGYLKSWELNFNNSIFRIPPWEFTNTFDSTKWTWTLDAKTLAGKLEIDDLKKEATLTATDKQANYSLFNYKFNVTNNWGFPQYYTLPVEVQAPEISPNPFTGLADDTISVNFTSAASWGKTYSWNFDNGETATGRNVSTKYIWEKNYNITVEVTSASGCKDVATAVANITVPTPDITQPNVFTPNGDDKNEYFKLENHAIKVVNMQIFNRWGRKVCELSSPAELSQGWDGTIDNKGTTEASVGTYFYVIKYEGKKPGHNGTLKGFLLLNR